MPDMLLLKKLRVKLFGLPLVHSVCSHFHNYCYNYTLDGSVADVLIRWILWSVSLAHTHSWKYLSVFFRRGCRPQYLRFIALCTIIVCRVRATGRWWKTRTKKDEEEAENIYIYKYTNCVIQLNLKTNYGFYENRKVQAAIRDYNYIRSDAILKSNKR